jgi:hypothetical protein
VSAPVRGLAQRFLRLPVGASLVIPRLDQDKRSEVAVERQAKRRRQTGGPSTPGAGRACVSFGQSPALGPGSRDGLSVHTVRDDSWRETGKPCRETSTLRGRAKICVQQICQPVNGRRHGGACGNQETCSPSYRESGDGKTKRPPNPQRSAFLRKSRKHGPLNLAPYLYFIGAQSSGPSGGDCTLPRSPGLDIGRTALLGRGLIPLTRAHVPPVRSPLRWGGLTGRRAVTLASPPARKDCSFRTTKNAARPQAPELCSTPGFLRGAVSGAREISIGALLPCLLHETIRPDFENGNAFLVAQFVRKPDPLFGLRSSPSLPPKQVERTIIHVRIKVKKLCGSDRQSVSGSLPACEPGWRVPWQSVHRLVPARSNRGACRC